jgi:hypothetical protein
MKNLKITLFLLFSFLNTVTFSQCAMCKATAESSGSVTGLNDGIIYIMFVPYLLLGAFVFFVFKKKIFTFWKELTGKGENKEYNIDNWY